MICTRADDDAPVTWVNHREAGTIPWLDVLSENNFCYL